MRLTNISENPMRALLYMERLVNDGSPSNFSFKHMSSYETCPLYSERYNICLLIGNIINYSTYGDIPAELSVFPNSIYIHPDWKRKLFFSTPHISDASIVDTNTEVSPTASSRTVKLLGNDYYIKMAYPGVLGRITRELCTEHVLTSLEVSKRLKKAVDSDLNLPSYFAFLPEIGGRVYKDAAENEIGFVVRHSIPYGKKASEIKIIIPAFSLFSKDRNRPSDVPLIIQVLDYKGYNIVGKKIYVFEQIICPVINTFFYCVTKQGLIPEMHSQNFLIGFDEDYSVTSIILRDLESIDKDITILESIKLTSSFDSYPYKCIDKTQYNYKIKHSFMYDHKLGEYFFSPLCKCLSEFGVFQSNELEQLIKQYVNENYGEQLDGFFPDDGKWYKFENVLIDRTLKSRPYISFDNPLYR